MPIHQYTNFFGTKMPLYGVCVGLGLLMIGIWMLHNFKVFKMTGDEQNEILFRFPFMVLFGVIVAFCLDAFFTGDWKTWTGPMENRKLGFTFTGWLLGAILFLGMFGAHTSFGRLFLANMLFPSFALAQAIGRVGCFLAGCCYGIPCECGVHYPEGSLPYSIVGDVPLFPIQLVESAALVLLFLICVMTPFRFRAVVYLMGISVIRFMVEFFRYDHRGDFCGLPIFSPQQYMSVVFLAIAAGLVLAERFKHEKNGLMMRRKDNGDSYGNH